MTKSEQLITIILISISVIITRFLPFLVFPEGKELPKYIKFLSKTLPLSLTSFLVVFCLKDAISYKYHSMPEILSIIFIIIIHKIKKNTLISIGAGVVLYMILVQNIFI